MVTMLNITIDGLLMGGIYALIAVGFGLQYGVARVLNVSHGEFLMLGAFGACTLHTVLGINPLVSLVICGPGLLIIGFILHRTLFTPLRISSESPAAFEGSSLLASFGLLFIIQNIALLMWGPHPRGVSFLAYPVHFLGATFGANRLTVLLFAVVISLVFYLFLVRTRLGKAIRAAGEDPATAGLMGVNINLVLALCFGFGVMMAGIAGSLISMTHTVVATMGMEYTVIAFIVVVLGGLGSIPGSLIGGFILGLIGSIVSYWEPGLTLVAYFVIFMVLLMLRPRGILGR